MKRLLIGALLLIVTMASIASGQEQSSSTVITIQSYPEYMREPVKIISVRYGDKEVKNDESFQAPYNWIKKLSVRVKNVSDQRLRYVEVGVDFARDEHSNPVLPQISLSKGFNYMFSDDLSDTGDTFIAPGEEVDLIVSKSEYEAFEGEFKNVNPSLSIVQTARIRALAAAFSPTRMWMRGSYLNRDLNKLNRWMVDEQEKNLMLRRKTQSQLLQPKDTGLVRKVSYSPTHVDSACYMR